MVSMDVLVVKILNFAQTLVDADRASLFLVDSKSKELYATIFDVGSSKEKKAKDTSGVAASKENKDNDTDGDSIDDTEVHTPSKVIRFPLGEKNGFLYVLNRECNEIIFFVQVPGLRVT